MHNVLQQEFSSLPAVGAWQLIGAHHGFEVTQFVTSDKEISMIGTSIGVEKGVAWNFQYSIILNRSWQVREAIISNADGVKLNIQSDGEGNWLFNGQPNEVVKGCIDLDLEGSIVTNTMPIHRLDFKEGAKRDVPAVYIRTHNLNVERLDQSYERRFDITHRLAFDYTSPDFGYSDTLYFDNDGLVIDYPEIGVRVPLNPVVGD